MGRSGRRNKLNAVMQVGCTIRGTLMRVITAREMSRRERRFIPKQSRKDVPDFESEEKEFEFLSTHDSADHIDWDRAVVNPSFPNLKPSTTTICIRLPEPMLRELKRLAKQQDVPYQSLMNIYLAERLAIERMKARKQRGAA